MFFIAYAFKGQVHVFAGRVKILNTFCPLRKSAKTDAGLLPAYKHFNPCPPEPQCLCFLKSLTV